MQILELIITIFVKLPIQTQIVAIFITVLFFAFLGFYLIKGIFLFCRYKSLIKKLNDFKKTKRIDPSELFSGNTIKGIDFIWSEYKETLHEQKRPDPETAIEQVYAIRATCPAETFFTNQILVDSRIYSDFFKHLPGIFTGLGIIGTFSGLIKGLDAFHVSDKTEIVRQSLDNLLRGVSEAFIVSAIAIGLAMVVTFLEKLLLAKLYIKVEELCSSIDSFFEAGAGEEYLERLVKASEDSASQSKILKDSLVGELKQILSELTQQQINASERHIVDSQQHISDSILKSMANQEKLSEQFFQKIEKGVTDPLVGMAEGFKFHREKSGEDLSVALASVLVDFRENLQNLFGGQISGINELQQKTVHALESAVNHLNQMVANVNNAGKGATELMASKLTEAIDSMDLRQQLMNKKMSDFLGQINNFVATSQNETNQKLQTLLSDLGGQVSKMVFELQTQSKNVSDSHRDQQKEFSVATANTVSLLSNEMNNSIQMMRNEISELAKTIEAQTALNSEKNELQQGRFVEKTEKAVADLTQNIERTVAQSSLESVEVLTKLAGMLDTQNQNTSVAVKTMQLAVSAIRDVTGTSINKMNEGAELLLLSADDFGKAGKNIAGVLDKITTISGDLSNTSVNVSVATRILNEIFSDYRDIKQNISQLLESLEGSVIAARKEASLTTDILSRIESSTTKLSEAQVQADKYLDSVADVLTETQAEFSESMRRTLKDVNDEFHGHLTNAIARLREGIEELGETLGGLGDNIKQKG